VAVALATAGVLLSCRAGIPRDAEWLAVVAAACSGVTLSLVRLLRRTDTNQVVFLSQGLFGTLLLLPFIFTTSPPSETVSWLLVAVMIAADISGQLCMNAGLARMPVATGASLMMLTPILSLVFGVVLFHEWLSPLQWFGCAVVLTASVLAVRKQSLQHDAAEE
jgi:drug/metabolite transporter (DMT)-like permease